MEAAIKGLPGASLPLLETEPYGGREGEGDATDGAPWRLPAFHSIDRRP
jgi:hypothetical protein